ncbi:glycosyltransferase [Saccharibacter floricola]|uniref:Glycosyltransferase n=1 Tax=Saccharibacter floricola DSM 15669 TaxID=1123227 RepID=A0ABQ0NZJ8_9PROT|nr:glycosyltransferase [Saccharibacter floricola]GBQ07463.1 glycosyltransferase [Saccharibacter floricola DSM 15669]
MKIHYIVTSLETGGAEFAIPTIINAIKKEGHSVDITACEPRDMGAAPLLDKAGLPYRVLFQKRPSIFKTIFNFIQILKAHKPDVIWTSLGRGTTVGQIAGALMGIPVVSWKHSASARLSMRLGKKLTSFWIADSSFVAQFLSDKMKIPDNRIATWPLYVCSPHQENITAWDGKTTLQIGSTGRLHAVKNYPYLLKGLALFCSRNPQWAQHVHLSIAGDGPQRSELEHVIQEHSLQDHVSLLGFTNDVEGFLRNLHVYTQPSHYEGMCLAVHEAMAMGLPIIATPVGEMVRSVQEGETGFLLGRDEKIIETFSTKLEEIFKNPNCLKKLGNNAQSYVYSHYGQDQYNKRCHKILQEILQLTHKI